MEKEYLQEGDEIFCECFLRYNAKNNSFTYTRPSIEGANFDGNEVFFDPFNKPYTIKDNS
jgi:hypothetical protein